MDIRRESGKEKVSHDHDQDHDDDDQEKMEKFFALVRDIRKDRDYIIKVGSDELNGNQNKRRKIEEKKPVAIAWNPSFQPEDFLEEIKQLNKFSSGPTTLVAGSSQNNEEIKKEEKIGGLGLGLDLNLPP